MVAEARDPGKGQLCGRDPLPLGDLGETLNNLEVVFDSLWGVQLTWYKLERGNLTSSEKRS